MTRMYAALAAFAVVLMAGPVEAQRYDRGYYGRGHDGYAPSYVVAESQFGNGTITGAVRHGPRVLQVRLPRGTWIDCVRSCSDTLRRETIDFWQTHGHNAPGSARGYLSFGFRY